MMTFFRPLPSSSVLFLLLPSSFFLLVFQMSPDVLQECSGQGRTSIESHRLQWAAPDLNRGALEQTGQRRTQPGNSGADWATPDLTRGAVERTGQFRTSPRELPSGVGSAGPQLPEDISEDVSEICQKRISKEMSEEMSKDMSERMSEDMSEDM